MLTDKFIEEFLQRYFKGELTQKEKEDLFASIKLNPALDDMIQEVLRKNNPAEVEKFISEKALLFDSIVVSEEYESMIELFLSGMMEPDEEEAFKKKLLSDEEFRNNALAQAFLFKAIQKIRRSDEAAIESAKVLSESSMRDLFAELKEEDDDELIDNFLKGKLSDIEEESFKNRLKKDTAFKERTSAIVMLNKGIQMEMEHNKKVIEDAKKLTHDDIANEFKKSIWSSVLRYSSAAAVVLLIAGVGFDYYRYTQAPSIAEKNMLTITTDFNANDGSSRGDDDSMYKELQTLLGSVKPDTDLKNTIEKLEKYYAKATYEYTDNENQYIDVISYVLATAYIYDGQRVEAKKILKHILDDKDAAPEIKDKSKELLDSINSTVIF